MSFQNDNQQLATGMMELFSHRLPRQTANRIVIDTRIMLDAEFTIQLFPYTYEKYLFGIEMKLGARRLYIVQRLREFIESFSRGEAYTFTKQFTYEPTLHTFKQADLAVIHQLVQIYHDECMYDELSNVYSVRTKHRRDERIMLIPPSAWEELIPLLQSAKSVTLEQDYRSYSGLQLIEELPPLQYEFDEDSDEGYRLIVEGFEDIVIMEAYGIIIDHGKLIKLSAEQCIRLLEMKKLLNTSHTNVIHIPKADMESFMETVIPGIKKLGNVHISQAVNQRIVQPQLKAKLFLDRVKNRLLAGLEFQYGDTIINPLEQHIPKREANYILMRDSDKEEQIVSLIEQAAFIKTEGGYFTDNEAVEYDFLYHTLPQLEQLLRVYATSAVKERLHTWNAPPSVRVTIDQRTGWLEFHFDMKGIPDSEIRELLKSLEEKRKYYRLHSGALLPLETEEFQDIVRLMNETGVSYEDVKSATLQLPIFRGLQLMDSENRSHTIKLGTSFRNLLDNMRNPDQLDFPVPESLVQVLRNYQTFGYQWLKTLAYYRFGGILADDMGLGKTLQSIAYIVSVESEIQVQAAPVLIVCPASLVYNWFNELKKFAPHMRAVIVDGSSSDRLRLINNTKVDVIITSYPLLRKDISRYEKQTFHTLFLDEAQAFKNYATVTAQAVKRIQAKHRFALTGTPLENSVEELWSIYDVVFPELFQDRKTFNDLTREQVVRRIRPFLLRRLKSDVLTELPEKIESIQLSKLLPEQKKLYIAYLVKLRQETLKHLNDNDFQKNRIRILAGLTRLRQICCHPALFVDDYKGGSAKFELLKEIIQECQNAGKRALIFSQFTSMLDIIRRELTNQGVAVFYLDGQTPSSERVVLCDRFNEGERDLFLISLKAGGTGLNLTGADTVILYDLWWNPAVEQQAADRAHRIGQKKVVQVIRLVSEGTVENKMYELQQVKKSLFEEVLQPGQEALSKLTEQDIRDILMI